MSTDADMSSTDTKVCIFVPSHIRYKGQLEFMDTCITSLTNQSHKADVFVSISFETKEFQKNFGNTVLKKFSPIVKFVLSREQKFQMEHLKILTDKYAEKYDLIMFCDDDDIYRHDRVEKFCECHNAFTKLCHSNHKTYMGVRELCDGNSLEDSSSRAQEYWCYGLEPYRLIIFFKICKGYEYLFKHRFADCYLRNYLRFVNRDENIANNYVFAGIKGHPQNYYLYREDNPDSLTKLYKSGSIDELEQCGDVGILCLMYPPDHNKMDKYFNDLSLKNGESPQKIEKWFNNHVVPFSYQKSVRDLCNKLYG